MADKKIIWIDAKNKKIEVVYVKSLEDMQKLVGGLIESAWQNKTTDLYIDEEGLYKSYKYGFAFKGNFYCGNGFLIDYNDKGDSCHCTMELEEIKNSIEFLTKKGE